ncbi:MAG: hypothetical protein HRU36_04005 [Rickettsiales bacterium]|nr:hypothetical protein [Rickettsiales bacterium]
MEYDHKYVGMSFQAENKFSLKSGNCLLKNTQITSGQHIELYSLSFFNCQNSIFSAPTIYLPYKTNVSLKNCKFIGDVLYLDPKHEQTHSLGSYRFFEGGRILIDLESVANIKEPPIFWKPRKENNEKECVLPNCKLIDGIPHEKYYQILSFDNDDTDSTIIGENTEETHTEL